MASIVSDPSSVVSAGVWTGTANVYASDNTFASDTGATQNTEYPFEVGGFNFAAIPGGATINSVVVDVEAKTGTAARAQIKVELLDGSTLIATRALANLAATDTVYELAAAPTLAQLKSASLKVRVTNKRIVSQSSTTTVDHVRIRVYYDVTAKAATLIDTFDTAVDYGKWSNAYPHMGATPVVESGRLKLQYTGTQYCGLISRDMFDLTESGVFAQVVAPTEGFSSRETGILLRSGGGDHAMLMIVRGASPPGILLRLRQNSSNSDSTLANYDPVAHAWFRMRIVGSTGYWDTSPDGTTWTNRRTVALTPANFAAVTVGVETGQYVDNGTYPVAYFDDLNTTPGLGRPKVWTGSAWVPKPMKVWTGSAWVTKPVKTWTGSAWETIT